MAPLLLFAFILIVVFGLMMLLTRPTRTEKLTQARLHAAAGYANGERFVPVDILKRDSYSDVPWLNRMMLRLEPASRLRKLIADAGLTWSVGRLVAGTLVAAALVLWLGHFFTPNRIIVILLAAAVVLAPYFFLLFKKSRRLAKFAGQLPDAMDLISRALRAGHSLTAAMELVAQEIAAPLGPEFRRVFDEQNLGLPQREALLNMTQRIAVPDLRFLVAAILIQRESGGNLVEVLDKTATVLRDRMKLQRQIRVFTAQGRLTGWILGLLPVIMFFLLSAANPQYMSNLVTDPMGQKLMMAGGVLMVLGGLVIRKIIRIKV
jgi:tight adherence protein B